MQNWLKSLFNTPTMQLHRQLQTDGATFTVFYPREWRYRIVTIGGKSTRWEKGMLAVTRAGITLYAPARPQPIIRFQCTPQELRWFGRPQKYQDGFNDMLIHVERQHNGGLIWQRLELRGWRSSMTRFVRALKQIATPEQITAYRRRRPYVHHGPVVGTIAVQDIYGAWELGESHTLYITPTFLVILNGAEVLRVVPMEHIQQIEARRRLDAPTAEGLVRFMVLGETFTYATADHDACATALADAARRTLETPLTRKERKKEEEEYEWDDDDDLLE